MEKLVGVVTDPPPKLAPKRRSVLAVEKRDAPARLVLAGRGAACAKLVAARYFRRAAERAQVGIKRVHGDNPGAGHIALECRPTRSAGRA